MMSAMKKSPLKLIRTRLCRMDGAGRVVTVATRKSHRAIERLANKLDPRPELERTTFLVSDYMVTDERADDHGTVYFFDLNGQMVEVHDA